MENSMHKPQAVNTLLCIISSFYKVGEKISQKMWADNFENLKKKKINISCICLPCIWQSYLS